MRNILIIEDNEADRFLNEVVLHENAENITIHHAVDGKAALELLDTLGAVPDLILLDINMPRMNGHEFLAAYTHNDEREVPVIVMLTSSSQERDKEQALQYKCVKEYLVKPIDEANVKRFIELMDEIHGAL